MYEWFYLLSYFLNLKEKKVNDTASLRRLENANMFCHHKALQVQPHYSATLGLDFLTTDKSSYGMSIPRYCSLYFINKDTNVLEQILIWCSLFSFTYSLVFDNESCETDFRKYMKEWVSNVFYFCVWIALGRAGGAGAQFYFIFLVYNRNMHQI